ncbi:hypothetical protein QVD17_00219 [Tagetes erecta]|uniref:Nicotianamine synthase n=1 Tax=Tagetes erecta TaxID=13708 RepID=A0AAD8P771_TARER|nr:hypothetical protein QVD17_00219 [Tagetes erecta]
MKSLQGEIMLVTKVCEIYEKLSKLETLKPSNKVDNIFTELVQTCIPPSTINIDNLSDSVREIRSKLVRICGEAERHLEAHYSTILASFKDPLNHLNFFPYYSNYLKLSRLEYDILNQHYLTSTTQAPKHIAFIGSGPLPLTTILLATYHLKETTFYNYDIDSLANSMAASLVANDHDLSKRMVFHSADILDVTDELKEYDVIFLAALVGMDVDEKLKVIRHLAKYMAPGAILMVRSAHGTRAFLYEVVAPQALQGFDVLSVFHPDDDVINSVVISRKSWKLPNTINRNTLTLLHHTLFTNAKTIKNLSLKPVNNQFATEFLARKNLYWQTNLRQTFAPEMGLQPILVTKSPVPIHPTEICYDHHVLFRIYDHPFLRPILGHLFRNQIWCRKYCDRICRCLFCKRPFCDRFSMKYSSQICYYLLKKNFRIL